ncbi:uncharacterized protein APUU_80842S [Aspergillus puulaauensis]|uniref:Uncharacterized protein n=1 Tax=Aspergillus puulaauensis TaxID=1220207 RepID=A0A7R7Y1P2_9EURO|nr:uncharacterized protein APUU_80842S [Aspergillus puulaauensis]BCS30539.1 hypothetical protein APUU_80842S [Aspergillus puulaauensis]
MHSSQVAGNHVRAAGEEAPRSTVTPPSHKHFATRLRNADDLTRFCLFFSANTSELTLDLDDHQNPLLDEPTWAGAYAIDSQPTDHMRARCGSHWRWSCCLLGF